MASVNKFIGIGNLTKDPECRYMTSGEAVTNCSIACNETWKGKDGSKQEKVEYINLVFYRRLAEVVGEYVKKGSMIYVEGKLQTRKWQDKEGKDRYTTEILVNEMTMLGGKSSSENNSHEEPPPANEPRQQKPQNTGKPTDQSGAPRTFENFDDDIPFDNPLRGIRGMMV